MRTLKWAAYLVFGVLTAECATTTRSTYRAAAVQYTKPASVGNARGNIARVLQDFATLAKTAKAQGAQIVVFPEASLWGYGDYQNRSSMNQYCEQIPHQYSGSLCHDPAFAHLPQLRGLSCIAEQLSITVVANMADVQPCDSGLECPLDGALQFNTDIAFSSNGSLLAKYHKVHIYSTSPGLDQPLSSDPVSFISDFGVEFGFIICYDIDFDTPSAALLAAGVRNFVFSTSWGNIPPLNTALLTQQGWSRVTHSNLIAANNAASPMTAGGSLMASGEPVRSWFNSTGYNLSTVLVGDLPLQPTRQPRNPLPGPLLTAPVVPLTKADSCTVQIAGARQAGCATVELHAGLKIELQATHNGLECHAQLDVYGVEVEKTKYALIALSERFVFAHTPSPLELRVCALVQCQNAPDCSPSFSSHGRFNRYTVSGNFSKETFVVPMVGVADSQPLPLDRVGLTEDRKMLWSMGATMNETLWGAMLYGLGNYSS